MKICMIKDCGRKHKAHGYCAMHFGRYRRHGDPLIFNFIRMDKHPEKCIVATCKNKYIAKGFCYMHYQRFRNNGDPLKTKRNPDGKGHINKEGYQTYRVNNVIIHAHRQIMEKHLGRKLLPFPQEIVHHIDENRLNNDISNLAVMTHSEHMRMHTKKRRSKSHQREERP